MVLWRVCFYVDSCVGYNLNVVLCSWNNGWSSTQNNSVRIFCSLIVMLVEETAWNRNDLKLELVKLCSRSCLMYTRYVAICLPLLGRTLEDCIIFHRWKPPCVVWRVQKMNSWMWEGQGDVSCEDMKWFCVAFVTVVCWIVFSRSVTHTYIHRDPTNYVYFGVRRGGYF
jgi:hypothetical protein